MRRTSLAWLALAASACSPQPVTKQPERDAAAARPAMDCPADAPSCGNPKSLVSDGIQPFESDGMGIRAWFPRGDRVCFARLGDPVRGPYAVYDQGEAGCAERSATASIGIESQFNILGYRSAARAAAPCRPLTAEMLRRFGGKAPAFAGHASIACEDDIAEGSLVITVFALAGAGASGDVPRTVYHATLRTRPDRLDRDVAWFQTFQQKLQIGLPSSTSKQKSAAE